MTDGIIQEVFKQYIKHGNIIYHSELYNKSTKKILFEIQQELIEKIKQRFPIDYDENYSMWHEAIQKILIGDNND